MVTRLYGVATTAADVSPAFGGWNSTTGAVRRMLSTTKGAATETVSGLAITSGAGNKSAGFQLVSPPLDGAQTISGTFSAMVRGRELATTDNVDRRWRVLRVFSNDGSTLRGTLVTLAVAASTAELPTTLAGQLIGNATALSSVSAQDGDRIVIEIGYGLSATGTSPQFDMVIGGNGTDHSLSEGDTSGTVPWIEFSQDLVFDPGTTPVTDDLDVRWAVRSAVTDDLDVRWAVRSAVTDQIDVRWAVRSTVTDQLDVRWAVDAAGVTTRTVFDQTWPGGAGQDLTGTGDTTKYVLGTHIRATEDGTATAVWFYVPTGAEPTNGDFGVGLVQVDPSGLGGTVTVLDWQAETAPAAGDRGTWLRFALDSPPDVLAGTELYALVRTNRYAFGPHVFDGASPASTDGVLVAPATTGGFPNGGFDNSAGANLTPPQWDSSAAAFDETWYGIDLEYATGDAGTTPVTDDLDVRWAVRAVVTDQLDARWRVLAGVTDQLDARWRVLSGLVDDLDARWRVLAGITDQLDVRWAVRSSVTDDLDARWRVLAGVTDQLDARWAVLTSLADQLDLRWAVLTGLVDDLDARWVVRATAADQLDVRWAVAGPVSDQLDVRWAVRSVVTDQLDVRWLVRAAVGDQLDVRWAVLSSATTPVTDQLDVRWAVAGRITDQLDVRWQVSGHITDQLDLRWRAGGHIFGQLDVRWAILAGLVDALELRWRVLVIAPRDIDPTGRLELATAELALSIPLARLELTAAELGEVG